MVRVSLLLDLVDVTDSQTVEQVHDDDHHEEQEDDEDEAPHPVFHGNVGIVELSSQHDGGPHQRVEDGAEVVKVLGAAVTVSCYCTCISRVIRCASCSSTLEIVNEAEDEGECEEEGDVREEDERVGLEDSCEHVDVERNRSVGHDPHHRQIQLIKIIK